MTSKKANIGTSLAALLGIACPVCWPAAGAFLASIGLGFTVSFKVILPLLFILLAIAWWGMYESYKNQHHQLGPFIVSVIAGISIPIGRYVVGFVPITYIAIGLFIGTALWNWSLIKSCKIKS